MDATPVSNHSKSKFFWLAIASLVIGLIAVILSSFLIGGILGLIGLGIAITCVVKNTEQPGVAVCGFALCFAAVFAGIKLGAFDLQSEEEGANPIDVEWAGVPAPNFEVTDIQGNKIRLNELKGKRVVLDFWATWCPPCVKEIPHFIDLAKETSRGELVIIGISGEPKETLEPFVKEKGMNYPVVSADLELPPYNDVNGIPTTFFIDRHGMIQRVLLGYHGFKKLKKQALQDDFKGEPKSPPSATNQEPKKTSSGV